jgi:hypothetical protein
MVEKKKTKTTKKETVKKSKDKLKLIVGFESKLDGDVDTISLKVSYNSQLKDFLNKVAVRGDVEFKTYLGNNERGNSQEVKTSRAKVKTPIWNGLSDGKNILFIRELLNRGEYTFHFYDILLCKKMKNNITSSVAKAIELIGEYSNVKHKVSFEVD